MTGRAALPRPDRALRRSPRRPGAPSRARRRIAVALLGIAAASGLAGGVAGVAGATPAVRQGSEPGRVLVISAPRLTWSTVREEQPPNLMRWFDRAALAACSTRTASSITRPGDAYLTIGAGNRMATVPESDGAVVARTEQLPEGDPSAVFQRSTGVTPTAPIVAIGKPLLDRFNEEEYFFGAAAGALADALDASGRSMAVVGNADLAFGQPTGRQVGLAAMDDTGQVESGQVGTELLRAADGAAFGLSTDADVVASVVADAWERDDVVLVELSDLERAERARISATPEQADRQYARALSRSDELVGRLLELVDPRRDSVIVVAPTPPLEENQLTVFGMTGPDVEPGWASSGTTRRDGYVTLTDVAPWILGHFDVDVPATMNDTPLSSVGVGDGTEARIDSLIDRSDRAVVRDHAFGPLTVVFIVAVVLDVALAILCLARYPALAVWVRGLALVVLSTPPVTFLLGLVPIGSPVLLGVAVALGAVAFALVAAGTAAVVGERADRARGLAPVVVLAILWAVLAVDIATGGRLQINTVFGYSPIVAGRFAGFGNQAFSMVALAALLVGATIVERRTGAGERPGRATLAAVAVWFLLTVVLDGAPSMGSDVGGVLAFVPAATVALLLFAGVRVRVRLAALIATATVAVLAAFAALDLSRPAEDRTHLGRFVSKVFDGGAGEIIQRKIAANLRVLTSVWTWVIPVALVYFAYLTWRPNRTLQRLQARHPQFRPFLISALTLGVLAMALNDSGVSLPAMMVALVVAFVSYHVVRLDTADPVEPPAESVAEPGTSA